MGGKVYRLWFFRRIIGKFSWDNRGEGKWFWDKKKKRKKRRLQTTSFFFSSSPSFSFSSISQFVILFRIVRFEALFKLTPPLKYLASCNSFLFFHSKLVLIKFVSLLRYQFTISASSTRKPSIDHFYLNSLFTSPINYPPLDGGGNFFNVDIRGGERVRAEFSKSRGCDFRLLFAAKRHRVCKLSTLCRCVRLPFEPSSFFRNFDFPAETFADIAATIPRQVVKSGLLNRFIRLSFFPFSTWRKRQVSRWRWALSEEIPSIRWKIDRHFVRCVVLIIW